MNDDGVDKVVWVVDTIGLLGRNGAKLALFAFAAWLLLRSIETTEQFAFLALLASIALLAWSFYRTRWALIVSARGVPIDGTVLGINEYAGASHSQGSFKMKRIEYSFEFGGERLQGKSTWHGERVLKDITVHQVVPLIVDPSNPNRNYWAPDLPGYSLKSTS